jgi:hypothetical protein
VQRSDGVGLGGGFLGLGGFVVMIGGGGVR